MKRIMKIALLMLLISTCSVLLPQRAKAQGEVSIQVFYDQLSPYGQWVSDPEYGYVWIPDATGFFPYKTSGYWVNTDYGWTWVSSYPWGWAPFHYGRWGWSRAYGWFWVPGTEWAPAWVVWSSSPDYFGWAPLAPGIGIDVVIGGGYHISDRRWVFCDAHYFGRPDIYRHYVPRANNVTIVRNATFIREQYHDRGRGTTFFYGPRGADVRRITGAPVRRYAIHEGSAPGHSMGRNNLTIYRPRVENGGGGHAPAHVSNANEIRPRGGNSRNPQSGNQAPARQQAPAPQRQAPAPQNNQPPRNDKQQPAPAPQQNNRPQRNDYYRQPETHDYYGSPRNGSPQNNRPQQQPQNNPGRSNWRQQNTQPAQPPQNPAPQPQQRYQPAPQPQQPQRMEQPRMEQPRMQQPNMQPRMQPMPGGNNVPRGGGGRR